MTNSAATSVEPPVQHHSAIRGSDSLLRAFGVLEVLADERRGVSLAELAELTGIAKATLRRITSTLANLGYVLIEHDYTVTLGPRLIHLGATASVQLDHWSKPFLDRLVAETGVTASLAVLDSDEVVYVGQSASHHSLDIFAEVGRRVPPHCTAVGKALLGQLPDWRVHETLERTGLPRLTPRTITDMTSFMNQLAVVRRQGYAFDDGEQDVGVRCVAVPVTPAPRNLAISLSAPESRMSVSDYMSALGPLEATARALSDALYSHSVITSPR
jgi:IclR family transcriptional regulator, acetate operon repressor